MVERCFPTGDNYDFLYVFLSIVYFQYRSKPSFQSSIAVPTWPWSVPEEDFSYLDTVIFAMVRRMAGAACSQRNHACTGITGPPVRAEWSARPRHSKRTRSADCGSSECASGLCMVQDSHTAARSVVVPRHTVTDSSCRYEHITRHLRR